MPDIDDDLIEVYELQFSTHSVTANPHMPQESSDLKHWLCTFSNDALSFDFYVSLGDEYEGNPPSGSQAMDLIRADIGFFRTCPGFADFAAKLGLAEDDGRAIVAFNEIERYSEFAEALLANEPKNAVKTGFGG
jgi:hypothetical protein